MNLFIAGHETTALALTWAWYLLAQHPAAAARLQAEADTVLGARLPRADDIPQLPFARMVVQETLRLYPPVWAIPRQVVADYEIGGYRVAAGSSVTMSQWVVHRDPRYFTDPLAFRPERWENNLEQHLPAFAFFPFGAGPRQCIGYSLAMTESILILALIGRAFRFSLAPGRPVVPWPSITLYPRHGLPVRLSAQPA
jgi:cytochrome P450